MSSDPDGYEYVAHRPERFAEQTFDTRHEAIGHAAVLGRYTDDEFTVFARRQTREPMVNDALWRAEILDEDLEHVGWTLLYETRSFAADAAYRYILANHLDMVRVSTMPWYGEDYEQVGAFRSGADRYPIYLGTDPDGNTLEHEANALQYREHWNRDGYELVEGNDGE
ncbi:hypothetical protein [Natrialba aegyptia]|uniref:Uncharacterized protein n=1 Tax=Natrialba aegyptia DSM 13077 TaxID=1227491 RepID=M0B5G0_9EURY|nr:hypothetical protein [Natrialba aegyptia]ELZ05772.1 hypothetical protein C480_10255 [Natrialba aegyptia DSM 13077]